jgi:hypothetical protein
MAGAVFGAGARTDVSRDQHFQSLARSYTPSLFHEYGEAYFPYAWTCDGDENPENNPRTYAGRCVPSVYIHILRNSSTGYIYIEYWYYYASNPTPLEAALVPRNLASRFIAHPQDWELAIVVLDPAERPVSFVLGAHGKLYPHGWGDAKMDVLGHPIAYVCQGSHAMILAPGLAPGAWGFDGWVLAGTKFSWSRFQFSCTFLAGFGFAPTRFGEYPAPWCRPIWTEVPSALDGATYN